MSPIKKADLLALVLTIVLATFFVRVEVAFGASVSAMDLILGAFSGGAWPPARIALLVAFVAVAGALGLYTATRFRARAPQTRA